jgi:hypothetical protein
MRQDPTTRRNFLLAGMAMAGSVACHQHSNSQNPEISPANLLPMPQHQLGNTGLSIPILGLGGAGQTPLSKHGFQTEAMAMIEADFQMGIRYFDTAAWNKQWDMCYLLMGSTVVLWRRKT